MSDRPDVTVEINGFLSGSAVAHRSFIIEKAIRTETATGLKIKPTQQIKYTIKEGANELSFGMPLEGAEDNAATILRMCKELRDSETA